jgi:hypothetical protein
MRDETTVELGYGTPRSKLSMGVCATIVTCSYDDMIDRMTFNTIHDKLGLFTLTLLTPSGSITVNPTTYYT